MGSAALPRMAIFLGSMTWIGCFFFFTIPYKAFSFEITNALGDDLLSFYVDRGDLNFREREYRRALEDYLMVTTLIEDNQIDRPSHLIQGICGSMFCYQCLDDDEAAQLQFSKLLCHISLLGEDLEKIEWIRNSPVYSNFKENQSHSNEQTFLTELPAMTKEEACELQNAGYAVAAATACARVPHPAISYLCAGCIFGLEQICVRCCKGQGFWENCVKGLRRLFHDPEHPKNPAPHPFE
ncbi:MAG: hypothetical protein JSS61_03095 [Verrucomicrobia bacterium]|nr:hypothetical protein [Verrucomicrobiota bacterium]